MSDQCGRCELRGKLHDCLREDCFQHDNWFAFALQEQLAEKDKEIERLKEEINIIRISCEGCIARKAEADFQTLDKMHADLVGKYNALLAENAALRETVDKKNMEIEQWKGLATSGCSNESECCPYYCMNEKSEIENAELRNRLNPIVEVWNEWRKRNIILTGRFENHVWQAICKAMEEK